MAQTGRVARAAYGCCALVVSGLLTSCSGTSHTPVASGAARGSHSSSASSSPANALSTAPEPQCTTTAGKAPALTQVATTMTPVDGPPFGVVTTPDGKWSFAALPGEVSVLSDSGPAAHPHVVRNVPLFDVGPSTAGELFAGAALTPDGRELLVASGPGAYVLSVAALEAGSANPVLGVLSDGASGEAASAIEVTVSPDGRYAFISMEYAAGVAVFDLRAAQASRYSSSGYRGLVRLGQAVVGGAISPDGKWLYATSELAAGGKGSTPGTLSVIPVAAAEADPGGVHPITVSAGCQPVRVVLCADGSTAWVTARASDALLAFSTDRLRSGDTADALVADVRVGEAPVGVALVDGGRLAVVADSNRFAAPGASSSLSVVDTAAALAGRPALLGTLATGDFPREMSVNPNGSALLVTDYASQEVQAVNLADLARLAQPAR